MGCGYIPQRLIDRFLLGRYHPSQQSWSNQICALQVRIIVPNMGIFKGVLVEKQDIEKIQLPPSMRKVGSFQESTSCLNPSALVLINQSGLFPFKLRRLQYENRFNEK